MKCVLRAEVPIRRFAVLAEMAWLERRPELAALCRAAEQCGRAIDADLVRGVLPGVTAAGARNVAAWCHTLGLCDARGALTSLGEAVAGGDLAPVPEQGVFELWIGAHPLVERRILHAARLRAEKDARFEDLEPLPVVPERDMPFTSIVSSERFLLRTFLPPAGAPACQVRQDRSACRVRWTIDFDAEQEHFQLDGALDVSGESRGIQHRPERAGIDVRRLRDTWAAEHLRRHGRFNHAAGRLAVSFEGLPIGAQDGFSRSYPIGDAEVPGKGLYTGVTLEDVPVGPSSPEDAQRWALARLGRRLAAEQRYRPRAEVRSLFASLVEKTPLEEHRPRLPAHAALLEQHRGTPAVFWGLSAAVDLAPIKVDAAELREGGRR